MLGFNRRITSSTVLILCSVFLVAVLLRFQYLQKTANDIHIAKDAEQYVNYGRNLARYQTFSQQDNNLSPIPDSFRSPGYPLLIAIAMKIGGESSYLKWVVYTQALLSAALVPLTFFTGIFFLTIPAAISAALLVAISPHLITTSTCLLTEILFSFLLLFAIFLFQLALRNLSVSLAGISAVLFGCAFLTNETALFLPFIFILALWWIGYFSIVKLPGKRKTKFIIVFLALYFTFPISWWLRGYYNVPAGMPKGSDRAVVTMSHGAYPGFIYKNPNYWGIPYREDPLQPVFGSSFTNFSKILWSRVKDEPIRYIGWYFIGKPYYLWNWNIIQGTGDIYINPVKTDLFMESWILASVKKVMALLHPLLLFLTLCSIPMVLIRIRMPRKIESYLMNVTLMPLVVCIYFTIICAIFAPWPRYSIPLRPELYMCAVWALSIIVKRLRNNKVQS